MKNKQKKDEIRIHVIDGPEDMVYDCDVCGYIGYSGGVRLDLANDTIIQLCVDCCGAIELRWGKDS